MMMFKTSKRELTKLLAKMNELMLFSAVLIGIAGSVHCVGMCGGVVTSFTFMLPKQVSPFPFLIAYNIGRILSYGVAGAIAGFLGSMVTTNSFVNSQILPLIGGIFMVLLGLYIGKWSNLLSKVERLGRYFWHVISPLSRKLIPIKHPLYALPYGMVWGWLPCGLVYSTLTWSVSTGDPVSGFLTMVFFGIGTLPVMLAMGATAKSIKEMLAHQFVRQAVALTLCGLGLLLTAQAIHSW